LGYILRTLGQKFAVMISTPVTVCRCCYDFQLRCFVC